MSVLWSLTFCLPSRCIHVIILIVRACQVAEGAEERESRVVRSCEGAEEGEFQTLLGPSGEAGGAEAYDEGYLQPVGHDS